MKSAYQAGVRVKLELQQIIAITGEVNYSFVHWRNGEVHLQSRSLKWFQEQLPGLQRVHKHALINIAYVHHYSLKMGRKPEGYVVMQNSLRLDVSRRNIKELQTTLMTYNQSGFSRASSLLAEA